MGRERGDKERDDEIQVHGVDGEVCDRGYVVGNDRDDNERSGEDEGKNCGSADDGTGNERDK